MIRIVLILGIVNWGCGLGFVDNQSGGADNLPTAGQGPFKRLRPDSDTIGKEPFVIEDRFTSDTDPTVLPREDGGARIWFARTPASGGASEIFYTEIESVTSGPVVAPTLVFNATEAWEQGTVRGPSVVEVDDKLVMFYEGGDSLKQIGRAVSSDNGATWTKDAGPVITGEQPSVALVDGNWFLALTTSNPGIWIADSEDGETFQLRADPTLVAGGSPEAFDFENVSQPSLSVTVSADQTRFHLFYVGRSTLEGELVFAIGHAGSFSGTTFQRSGDAPVMDPEAPNEFAPAMFWEGSTSTLFFSEEASGARNLSMAVSN